MNETNAETSGGGSSRSKTSGERWSAVAVCIFLAAITWSVFGQTIHFNFVNFDDNEYVYENPMVGQGLTRHGIVWAFTRSHALNWHPVTWISHMVDCEFYELDPGGPHLTNVLLHAMAAILLFLVLRNATGYLWRSAFVAAVFAIHPLRAESVAWVSERKDVLSGVFFMLTIAAYLYYARRNWSPLRYGLVVVLFALGLMSKPMLVTLPVVLILLDYWPLNRFRDNATEPSFQFAAFTVPRRVVLEKLPLFGLSLASSAITFLAQSHARVSVGTLSLSSRVVNAVISYAVYLAKIFWPSGLAAMYPYPAHRPPLWESALAMALLVSISIAVFIFRKTRPYLLVGWLWYFVMLTPVIGIFQTGAQARADRYTYLPQIGCYVLLTWLVAEFFGRWRIGRYAMTVISVAALTALMICARVQTGYWQNSESLWTRALACSSNNSVAEENLGSALLQKPSVNEAIDHFQKALAINPHFADAHASLGAAFYDKGELDQAIAEFQKALELDSRNAGFHSNLGNALLKEDRVVEAVTQYETATQIAPDDFVAQNDLGTALLQEGNTNAAISHFENALRLAQATGRWDASQQLAAVLNSLRIGTPTP